MCPTIWSFSFFRLPSFGAMLAVGYLAAMYFYLLPRAEANGFKREDVYDLVFYPVVAGLLGAKLLYDIVYWQSFGPDFISRVFFAIRNFQIGFIFYGGLVSGAAVFYLIVRRRKLNLLAAADFCAVGLAIANVFGQIGCFLAGCCYGAPSGKFPGVVFKIPGYNVPQELLGVPLYPVQLIEALGNVAIAVLLHRAFVRKLRAGYVVAFYSALYAVLRFHTEFLRGDDRGAMFLKLSQAQWISAAGFIIAAIVLFVLRRKPEDKKA